jgi:nitrogen fixation protein NifU and related proteins
MSIDLPGDRAGVRSEDRRHHEDVRAEDLGLQDLYQEVILDHNRHPRNFRVLEGGRKAEGYNPLCGDRLTVYLRIENDTIADVAFHGSGCAISKASASLMTDSLKGKSVSDAAALFERFQQMITAPPESQVEQLGKLAALAGVRQFPVRVKCASLAWHTLKAAIDTRDEVVSTE